MIPIYSPEGKCVFCDAEQVDELKRAGYSLGKPSAQHSSEKPSAKVSKSLETRGASGK